MSSILDAIYDQYEKSKQSKNSSQFKMSQEERMKKYFTAILPENQRSAQKRIRILPTKDGKSPFVEAWFHEILQDGKYVKLYDPGKNDNERSPLNEVYNDLISTGKQSDKELANEYKSRKFYVVKVIDRDHPEDGVKFWRFKHNYKGEGPYDKIIPIFKAKGDITDPEKGRDLIIELAKAKTSKNKDYTYIQTIMFDDPSPLSDNKETSDSWITDELTWKDVYSRKPEEYLDAISRGEKPRWDSEQNKFVYGDTSEDTVVGGAKYTDPQSDSYADDDMPF